MYSLSNGKCSVKPRRERVRKEVGERRLAVVQMVSERIGNTVILEQRLERKNRVCRPLGEGSSIFRKSMQRQH